MPKLKDFFPETFAIGAVISNCVVNFFFKFIKHSSHVRLNLYNKNNVGIGFVLCLH